MNFYMMVFEIFLVSGKRKADAAGNAGSRVTG